MLAEFESSAPAQTALVRPAVGDDPLHRAVDRFFPQPLVAIGPRSQVGVSMLVIFGPEFPLEPLMLQTLSWARAPYSYKRLVPALQHRCEASCINVDPVSRLW